MLTWAASTKTKSRGSPNRLEETKWVWPPSSAACSAWRKRVELPSTRSCRRQRRRVRASPSASMKLQSSAPLCFALDSTPISILAVPPVSTASLKRYGHVRAWFQLLDSMGKPNTPKDNNRLKLELLHSTSALEDYIPFHLFRAVSQDGIIAEIPVADVGLQSTTSSDCQLASSSFRFFRQHFR